MPDSPVLDLGFARLDLGREQRQGLAEVVYAPASPGADHRDRARPAGP